MWTIREHASLSRALKKVPVQIREKYEVWKDIVRHSGPQGLARIRGFNDEALKGDWDGWRSSRLSQAYRVIYSVEQTELQVLVERVSKHDYRKG
jgi:addiction module RelE/StbE family toxin